MPIPLPLSVAPPSWELFLPPSAVPAYIAGNWLAHPAVAMLPAELLLPLVPLFEPEAEAVDSSPLAGLQAQRVTGLGVLPETHRRPASVFWAGLSLAGNGSSFFNKIRQGCWVCGFPAVGRGREVLRSGLLHDEAALQSGLSELGDASRPSNRLYFNFHYDNPLSAWDRVYVLDEGAGRLHSFALARSALAPVNLK